MSEEINPSELMPALKELHKKFRDFQGTNATKGSSWAASNYLHLMFILQAFFDAIDYYPDKPSEREQKAIGCCT